MPWYIGDGKQTFGPYSDEQLRAIARAGKVTKETRVRLDNGEWVEARRVNGLLAEPLTIMPPTPTAQAVAAVPAVPVAETASRPQGGVLLLIFGVLTVLFFGLVFDTSVSTDGGRVSNYGLMNDRLVGVACGIGLVIVGAIARYRR